MEDIISKEEMQKEKEVILKVFKNFEGEFKDLLAKKTFNIKQFNDIADKAIEKVSLTARQKEVVDGFLTVYFGAFVQYGNIDYATDMVFKSLGFENK
ncbi:hypothetical protein [Dethiothermospora halolimnae]|uniref:hypothetical protein n=1 Tax=Dethiothermospora halolimnae TaxID=3114390 RepID=UPI003CCBE48C